MPARVQVVRTGRTLRVVFSRIGQEPVVMVAKDGEHAWQHAILMISQQEELEHGDLLSVRRTGESS
jgi:hypothetical protein